MDQAEMRLKASMPKPVTLSASWTSSVTGGSGISGEAGANTTFMVAPQRPNKEGEQYDGACIHYRGKEIIECDNCDFQQIVN